MVDRPRARIECGKVIVDFHVRRDLERATTVDMNTPRGPVRVSSPEATALELVGYAKHAGGLDNVATVLSDMAESIDAQRLVEEAARAPLAWSQRLGFLLELVEAGDVASLLQSHVEKNTKRVTALDASLPRTGAERSKRWRVAINTRLEMDA
jgi:predicted transcriptional regulator of viral defense system